MGLWGLIVAKARATFSLSDIVHPDHIKPKVSKVFYLGIMVGFFQLLKLSAESNVIDTYVDSFESRVDSHLNEPHKGAPKVHSSRLDLSELNKFRQSQVKSDKTINDFNFHEKLKLDEKKVEKEMKA